MDRTGAHSVWERVKDDRLTRVLIVYLSSCFIVLQVVDIFTEQLGLPDWFFPAALSLLAIGLPIIVTTALVQSARERPHWALSREDLADQAEVDLDREAGRGSIHQLFTWRHAIAGGVAAFAALGLAVAAYMITRSLGIGPAASLVAAGALEERDPLLVADFANRTADPSLGTVVTEAFRVDLAQSPLVTIVPPQTVQQALYRMEKPPDTPLAEDLAREIAQREGIKAVLAGELGTAGRGFLLSARLIRPETGEALAAYRESARDSTQLVEAIDRLSGRLRGKIGESLKTIRASEPLERVTTSSLEALRKYSLAERVLNAEADVVRGMALLEEAVAIDSGFAMAWRRLGAMRFNIGDRPTLVVDAFRRAYEHRNRLTDRERYLTLGSYYSDVTGERDKAVGALESLLEEHPYDAYALNNLGLQYWVAGELDRAAAMYARSMAADSLSFTAYLNLVDVRVRQNRLDQAEAVWELMQKRLPPHPAVQFKGFEVAAVRGDMGLANERLARFEEGARELPSVVATAEAARGHLAALQGGLAEAKRHLRAAVRANDEQDRPRDALRITLSLACLEGWLAGDTAGSLAEVDSALAARSLERLDPLDRPYLELALFYASAGRPARARALVAEYGEAVPAELHWRGENKAGWVAGAIAYAEQRSAEAIAELRRVEGREPDCLTCTLPYLGLALETSGEPDSAIAVYERYVRTPFTERYIYDPCFLPRVYERLAGLLAERGEAGRAAVYYAKLVELWKDADAELQPRVEAAKRAIRALTPLKKEAG
jgi:eukaryotic-like serine/threonine-protein kinase